VKPENSAGHEAAPPTPVAADLVQQLTLSRKGPAMASIQLLVRLMEVGDSGERCQSVSYMERAMGQKGVKGNVTAQNLNTVVRTVKEAEQ